MSFPWTCYQDELERACGLGLGRKNYLEAGHQPLALWAKLGIPRDPASSPGHSRLDGDGHKI